MLPENGIEEGPLLVSAPKKASPLFDTQAKNGRLAIN
jgi:hypothetical protein